MSDDSVAAARKLPPTGLVAALRFLFADAIGVSFLLWLLVAFVLRPMVLDAHAGGAGGVSDWLRSHMDTLALSRACGTLQGASLAGLVLVLALVHVRLSAAFPQRMSEPRTRLLTGIAHAFVLTAGYLAFVWTPVTAVSLMLHDTFIFFDAIYRIDHGQRPSTDFPTALGAASLYLPWLGSKMSGGYAGAIEISSAMVAFPLCLACALACARRHGGAVTAVLIAAIFLMVVPSLLEGYVVPDSATFEADEFQKITDEYANAMFYNRWGWGALLAMFAFLTPRTREEGTSVAETVVLGLLLAFLFWLKLSYFVVGAAVAVLYAFIGPNPWRTLAIGAAAGGGVALSIALLLGNLFSYLNDILTASRVSGARFNDLAVLLRDNLLYILLALAPISAMAITNRLKAIDYAISGLILGGTFFVVNQNAQMSGLPTLLVVAAYALWRMRGDADQSLRLLAILAFALPAVTYLMDRGSGLIGQTGVARREEARGPPAWAGIPALHNVYAQERENVIARIEDAVSEEDRMVAFRAMSAYGRRQFLRTGEYIGALQTGMDELQPVIRKGESVVVMDFSSPLAFLMNARPAKGYWLTFDDGRTISEKVYPEAAQIFADADHVMLPKLYAEPDTAARLGLLYSDWLDAAYLDRVETRYWTRWSHRKPALRPATQMSLIPPENGGSRAPLTVD